jgi:hypothetical protein
MAVAGVVPLMGEMPVVAGGTTGLVPVMVAPGTGGTAGVVAGMAGFIAAGLVAPAGLVVVGGVVVWPNEVSARVTEQRLAISSVFIGLIGKFSRARIR